jgi:PilZ domain
MERREQERLPIRQTTPQSIEQLLPYRVVNVSKSGCFLESREVLGEVESAIAFELPLPAGAESLTLGARIVWRSVDTEGEKSVWFRYGLHFNGIDRISELILDAYIEFLRRDLHVAQLEEAWLKLKRVHEKIELLIAFEEKKMASFLH